MEICIKGMALLELGECVMVYTYLKGCLCTFLISLASGDGEKILQFCPSFHIVQKMREGYTPQQACESTVSTMKGRSREWFEVAVIALDTKVMIRQTPFSF